MPIAPSLKWPLGITIVVYLAVMYVIGLVAQRKVQDVDDFLVAGRKLPLSLAWLTLLATWFGAGTMLTAADEVRAGGLQKAALDPFGAGTCLLLAALLVAGPMWRMKLLTVPDFFRRKFGPAAELIAALILVPSYFGWIAAQFSALAEILELFFGVPVVWGLVVVAVVGTGYTLMGGMWSVTLTDAVQMVLVLGGLIALSAVVLLELGGGSALAGLQRLGVETQPSHLVIVPTASAAQLVGWLGVFAIGALGNLPGQDLMQRVFAADSERTARRACYLAGTMYLGFGTLPLVLALSGSLLLPDETEAKVLPLLAHAFLHPVVAVVFVVALLSAILSTIDSAILSPSSVLAQNVFPRLRALALPALAANRIAVLGVSACSLVLAYVGESAYALLEEAYLLTMVGLFVPLILGLYSAPSNGRGAIAAMLTGTGMWALHFGLGWEEFLAPLPGAASLHIPLSLGATGTALLAYFIWEPPWRTAWGSPADCPG